MENNLKKELSRRKQLGWKVFHNIITSNKTTAGAKTQLFNTQLKTEHHTDRRQHFRSHPEKNGK